MAGGCAACFGAWQGKYEEAEGKWLPWYDRFDAWISTPSSGRSKSGYG
ncbi:MAG: hypothetical protein HC936_04615 [Leptolyngbyaceae cyanobacterium SU_3_3]|nr:hypothetical protein [Leptolyngbyaceae cyanobacterium SU_3_3]